MAGFTDPLAIGKVTTAEETFKIQRGDQTIEIGAGDFIYLDDVISAGGTSVGIAFADQTTMSVDPNSKYRQRQINQNPVSNLCLLICFAKRYFDSPSTSLCDPIIMLSLFISHLSEEDAVFRFSYSYTQPTVKLYITPLIAFIFDEFTFFEATP